MITNPQWRSTWWFYGVFFVNGFAMFTEENYKKKSWNISITSHQHSNRNATKKLCHFVNANLYYTGAVQLMRLTTILNEIFFFSISIKFTTKPFGGDKLLLYGSFKEATVYVRVIILFYPDVNGAALMMSMVKMWHQINLIAIHLLAEKKEIFFFSYRFPYLFHRITGLRKIREKNFSEHVFRLYENYVYKMLFIVMGKAYCFIRTSLYKNYLSKNKDVSYRSYLLGHSTKHQKMEYKSMSNWFH